MDILGVDIERPAIVGRELEVQAVILDDILVLDLAARQRLLDAAGGNVGRRRAAVARTPAVARKRDIAALEAAVLVILIIVEAADGTFGARRGSGAGIFLLTAVGCGIVFRHNREAFKGVVAPRTIHTGA